MCLLRCDRFCTASRGGKRAGALGNLGRASLCQQLHALVGFWNHDPIRPQFPHAQGSGVATPSQGGYGEDSRGKEFGKMGPTEPPSLSAHILLDPKTLLVDQNIQPPLTAGNSQAAEEQAAALGGNPWRPRRPRDRTRQVPNQDQVRRRPPQPAAALTSSKARQLARTL